jgi:LAO/AO transport system kinase
MTKLKVMPDLNFVLFTSVVWCLHSIKKGDPISEPPFCLPGRARTCDPLIKSQLLYQLSYGEYFLFSTDRLRTCDPPAVGGMLYLLSYGEFRAAKLEKYTDYLNYLCQKNSTLASKSGNNKSALRVNKGIEPPPAFNPEAVKRFKISRRELHKVKEYADGIMAGNRTILSKAITLIESALPHHQQIAQEVIEQCLPHSGNAIRIGITGVPGVGKSTFIEALGTYLTGKGRKLAILAIDPSSQKTKGSILGDKTRMEKLATDPNAFIRPSPSAGSLGGVARKTREIIILCEAAGFDTIFVETVGVGQSETAVHSMVDFFLLLMLAGAGDELQGIKRGIMEMADAIIINKADGDNLEKALVAKQQYANALHLFPPSASGWIPEVDVCSSLTISGINKVWEIIDRYYKSSVENGFFVSNRKQQNRNHFQNMLHENLLNRFYRNKNISSLLSKLEKEILDGHLTPFSAAQKLLDNYFASK